jgi:hypothetical protein
LVWPDFRATQAEDANQVKDESHKRHTSQNHHNRGQGLQRRPNDQRLFDEF